jgi:hypothetical protein
MNTRSGSIDPGAILYLLRERNVGIDALDRALNFDSGIEGHPTGGCRHRGDRTRYPILENGVRPLSSSRPASAKARSVSVRTS